MSLTSYRAAPPRDKPLRALSKTNCRNGSCQRLKAPFPSGGFLRRQPLAMPSGRGGYVPTRACFGKGREVTFEDFVTANSSNRGFSRDLAPPPSALARSSRRPQPCGQKQTRGGQGQWIASI